MNTNFKIKLLQNLSNRKANQGFTLIELLVVVIIIGVLAAIALPNLLGQVAKGRQAEAKDNLGAINRGQQAYVSEKGTFGTITNTDSAVGVKVAWQYYSIAEGVTDNTGYTATAQAVPQYENDIKNYASAVTKDTSNSVFTIICESSGTASAAGAVAITLTTSAAPSCLANTNQVN